MRIARQVADLFVQGSLRDISVFLPNARRVLVVDICGCPLIDPAHIERMRQRMMKDVGVHVASFFLAVKRGGLYLWRRDSGTSANPDVASVQSIWRDYAPWISGREDSLGRMEMGMAIHSWLEDLAGGRRKPKSDAEADQLLVRAGAYEEMRGGILVTEDDE